MVAFKRYESILAECFDAMRLGATVEDCLERYPGQAERLRPALLLAEKVSKTPMAQARPNAKEQSWRRIEKRLAELQTGKQTPAFIPSSVRVGNYLGWLKPVAITAVAVFAVGAMGGGAVLASQSAMPDSPLYRVKLAGEDVRVWFISDDIHKANVRLDQSRQRMEEINDTVRNGGAVPENALSAMENRNRDAFDISQAHLEDTELRARVRSQAEEQEDRLLALWQEVPTGAQDTYTEVVADLHNTQLSGGAAVAAIQPEELSGGIFTIAGLAENTAPNEWLIGGVQVRIDEQTLNRNQLAPGSNATVLVARASNGRLHALNWSNFDLGSSSAAVVSGAVEEVTKDGVRIAGQLIPFDADTLQFTQINVGDRISIKMKKGQNGVVADQVTQSASGDDSGTIWFEGTIQGDVSGAASRWTVSGLDFDIKPSTGTDASAGAAVNGARVLIEAAAGDDGELQARRITVLSSGASGDTATIIGRFDGYFSEENGIWDISGLPVTAPADIEDPPDGALILIDTRRDAGSLEATSVTVIETPDGPSLVQLQGTILETHGARWTLDVGNVQVHVPSTSKVFGKVESGKRVMVWGTQGEEGVIEGTVARILDDQPLVVVPEPTPAP